MQNLVLCQAAAREIGWAIYRHCEKQEQGNQRAAYKKAYALLQSIGFTDVEFKRHWFKPDEIIVTMLRPGILIGHRGSLIEYIKEILKNLPCANVKSSVDYKLSKAKLLVKEDKVVCHTAGFYVVEDYY